MPTAPRPPRSGSTGGSAASLGYNRELGILTCGSSVVAAIGATLADDYARAEPYSPTAAARPAPPKRSAAWCTATASVYDAHENNAHGPGRLDGPGWLCYLRLARLPERAVPGASAPEPSHSPRTVSARRSIKDCSLTQTVTRKSAQVFGFPGTVASKIRLIPSGYKSRSRAGAFRFFS